MPYQNQRPVGQGYQPRPPQPQRGPSQPFNRQPELDEARHRYFEDFGGHTEEDLEAVRFMLDMDRVVTEAAKIPMKQPEPELENTYDDEPPPKNGRQPVRSYQNQGMPREPRRNPNPGMQSQNPNDPNRRRRGKRRHQRVGGQRPMPRMPQ